MTRVPHVGARAAIRFGCTRTSVAELIGMLVSIALGEWPIFASAFPVILGGAPGFQACRFAQVRPSNAIYRSVAIRLLGNEN